jgi:hypothetical protein
VTYREETDLTVTPEPVQAPGALLGKLLKIAKAIKFVEKRGHNEHHGYDFVQAVDITRLVRDQLIKNKLMIVPAAGNAQHLPYGSKGGHLTTVDLAYVVHDTETGESITIPWVGVGADTGGDKGIYKAYTGGFKYALIALFQIPMTNDPERDLLTDPSTSTEAHPDETDPLNVPRVPNPRIPVDRAQAILQKAILVGLAELDLDAPAGTPPKFHAVLKAKLSQLGVDKIGELNSDSAEDMEAFLANEQTSNDPAR